MEISNHPNCSLYLLSDMNEYLQLFDSSLINKKKINLCTMHDIKLYIITLQFPSSYFNNGGSLELECI